MQYPKAFQNLIHHFSGLPSIGPKAAERIVLYLFKQPSETLVNFAESLESLPNLTQCSLCFNVAQNKLCDICADTSRDHKTVCVVEEPLDIFAFERLNSFKGVYHVLGGVLEGNKSDDFKSLKTEELFKRAEDVKEIILATNPTTEGDFTALFLKKELEHLDVRISRLARGLTSGGDIEYVDEVTLRSALKNRESLK